MAATSSSGTATVTLPTDEQILITQEFDAPKHLVFKAWTTPELVRRWWSGQRGRMTVVEMDPRVGGRWRYVMVADDGTEVAFHGEYREIIPDERLVSTEVYETEPPPSSPDDAKPEEEEGVVNIVTFTEAHERTTLTLLVQCPSKQVRDAIIDSGMEVGMQEQMDLLERIAISLR